MTKSLIAIAFSVALATPAFSQTDAIERDVVMGDPEMLGALHLVVALHEVCRAQIPLQALNAIGYDAKKIEERMGLSREESEASYQQTLASAKGLSPECDSGSLSAALGSYALGISPFGGL